MSAPLVLVEGEPSLRQKLEAFAATVVTLPNGHPEGICGFDGFIDTFIRVRNPATMAAFGGKVQGAAGISASYEAEHLGDRFGGNGPLLAHALHSLAAGEIDLTYIGAVGRPTVQPIFQQALGGKMCRIFSLAEPAHSDCLEFKDGKIMLSDLRTCSEIDWARLIEVVTLPTLDGLLRSTDFVAAVNWGKLPNVESIWAQFAERLKVLDVPSKQVLFFMDLAEFDHRNFDERRALLKAIANITQQCRTILSLNLKEAWQLAEVFIPNFPRDQTPAAVAAVAGFLRSNVSVDQVIVHPNNGAASATAERTIFVPGPFCRDPLTSVGAGDHFGAGCLLAALCGLEDLDMLLSGVCTSGHFVRSGLSPTWTQVSALAGRWTAGNVPDRFDS